MEGAERELLAGNNPGAQTELHAAIALDPTYKTASERLAQVIAMDPPQQRPAATERALASPIKLLPQPGTHTFDLHGDTQSVYTEVAKQFGITAQFDSDLPLGRGLRFRVPDVDFETAMNVLAAQTHTFWAPYDSTRIIIADDQPAKRKLFEQLAIHTFLLPASLSDEDMTNTLRVVREIVGITRTSLDISARELTVRDTPKNIDIAAELIDQIEQGRGELVLEVELLEVDRTAARNLGITPPTTSSVIPLTICGNYAVETSAIHTGADGADPKYFWLVRRRRAWRIVTSTGRIRRRQQSFFCNTCQHTGEFLSNVWNGSFRATLAVTRAG